MSLGLVLGVAGVTVLPVSLIAAFKKRWRRKAVVGVVASVALFIAGATQMDSEAKQGGWESLTDQNEAKKHGFADATLWHAQRTSILAKQAEDMQRAAAKKEEEDRRTQQLADAKCKTEVNCWAKQHSARASVECRPYVERLAKNNFEWADGWTEAKFPRARISKNGALITYVGDAIKFQNGFGAWIYHTYECDYDPTGQQVLAVRAFPGRLPL